MDRKQVFSKSLQLWFFIFTERTRWNLCLKFGTYTPLSLRNCRLSYAQGCQVSEKIYLSNIGSLKPLQNVWVQGKGAHFFCFFLKVISSAFLILQRLHIIHVINLFFLRFCTSETLHVRVWLDFIYGLFLISYILPYNIWLKLLSVSLRKFPNFLDFFVWWIYFK